MATVQEKQLVEGVRKSVQAAAEAIQDGIWLDDGFLAYLMQFGRVDLIRAAYKRREYSRLSEYIKRRPSKTTNFSEREVASLLLTRVGDFFGHAEACLRIHAESPSVVQAMRLATNRPARLVGLSSYGSYFDACVEFVKPRLAALIPPSCVDGLDAAVDRLLAGGSDSANAVVEYAKAASELFSPDQVIETSLCYIDWAELEYIYAGKVEDHDWALSQRFAQEVAKEGQRATGIDSTTLLGSKQQKSLRRPRPGSQAESIVALLEKGVEPKQVAARLGVRMNTVHQNVCRYLPPN